MGGPPSWGFGEVLTVPHRKNVLKSENVCYGLLQNLLSSTLLSINIKIKI